MNTCKLQIFITVLGYRKPVDVTVEYTYTPAIRGLRERGGRQVEPDALPEFDLHKVWLAGNMNIAGLLSDSQIKAIEKELTL